MVEGNIPSKLLWQDINSKAGQEKPFFFLHHNSIPEEWKTQLDGTENEILLSTILTAFHVF